MVSAAETGVPGGPGATPVRETRMSPSPRTLSHVILPAVRVLLICALTITNLPACQPGGNRMDLSQLVPESSGTWTTYEDSHYDKQTIFDYMDGAGEVFLSFAYERMFVRRFSKSETEALTVEVYDMGTPADAYGIFTRFRSGEDVEIGRTSSYTPANLNFWKGRYFITVFTMASTGESKADILDMARSIDAGITYGGDLPLVVTLLPTEDLIEETIRFFHLHTDLNRHYFVSDSNILDLDREVDAAIATYREGDGFNYLLVIRYPEEDRAATVFDSFLEIYMPEAAESGIVQIEDGLWAAAVRIGEFITVVFDASTSERALLLLEAARGRIEGVSK